MGKAGTKGVSRAERERQIVDVALEEFGGKGYSGVSVAAVALRAGISKPLVYSYFDSKDGLYLACVHRVGGLLVDAVAAAGTRSGSAQHALDTLSAIFTAVEDCRYAWAVLYDPALPPAGETRDAVRFYRGRLAAMGAAGAAGLLSHAGHDDPLDHQLLDHVWQYTVAAVMRWWSDHPDQSAAEMTARCARLLTSLGAG
ncbi:TetR/AcrR family transcriptional regulator [Streptomyces sp. NPDC059688]|uniref:TetR/AcrR family transcriptional regulator n=2 Tax=Streptomyces TaxID=1883 RepID=A0ABV1U7I2_9ACTN|nr:MULTISPECIES: TetR/AcrR family transcriptional regulator [unclassified Streptomyces]OKJ80750.1 TetR family transcriptional regulator [Streptomyces sp. CB01883]ROP55498.1 TetR family transcriptional regulator [Streptomyces sp. PanSC9]UXY33731.1 TetR/AcrR family transcriptional regulator [Streptomyces sp. HUAS 14-6]